MPKTRLLFGALTAATFGVASLFAAAPAYAATLPQGEKISVADWDTFQFSYSSTEGALTPVGTGVIPSEYEYLEGVDVDKKGVGYAITTEWVPAPPPEPDPDCDPEDPEDPDCVPLPPLEPIASGAYLYTANAATGALGSPGIEISILTGPLDEPLPVAADSCLAIDYTAGAILAACNLYGEGDSAWIGYIDPATGYLTPYLLLEGQDFIEFTALAVNPVDGVIWGFSFDVAFTLVIEGADIGATPQYPLDMDIYAADFDSSGQLWASAYRWPDPADRVIGPNEEGLVTINLADGTFGANNVWSDPEAVINSLTVWGEALPATGPANPVVPVTAAAIALLAGAILAGVTVLRRRSEDAA